MSRSGFASRGQQAQPGTDTERCLSCEEDTRSTGAVARPLVAKRRGTKW
jgi:hypothetical protein